MTILTGRLAAVALLVLSLAAGSAQAARLQIINLDGPGEGLNDNTPVAPMGGNSGTTLGEQRRIALQFAADVLGDRITSSVPIRIASRFDRLQCSRNSAALGQAAPVQFASGFSGQPIANTFYPLALANALAGRRIAADSNDINATFNATLDSGFSSCLQGRRWYYGLDGRQPAGRLNFLSTAVHELTHGLGFVSLVALRNSFGDAIGEFPRTANGNRLPDIYSRFIKDLSLSGQPTWPELSAEQRADSITNGPDVVWRDANTANAAAGILSDGLNQGFVQIFAPANIAPSSSISHWDVSLDPDQLMEPFATGRIDVTDGIGLATCALENIGWQLMGNARCPSTENGGMDDDPPPGDGSDDDESSDGDSNTSALSAAGDDVEQRANDGGGGCTLNPEARFDPVFAVLLMLALVTLGVRRRRRD